MPHLHVAVIGAGIIGAAIADALASRGARVTVFDMRAPGQGASQASAGVLCPFTEATPGSPLLEMGARSLRTWPEYVERIRARTPEVDFEFTRCGTTEVALTADEASSLRQHLEWLRGEQVSSEWFDPDALRQREPAITPSAHGGLFIADHAFVQVWPLVRALVQAAKLAGAVFVTPIEVVLVEPVRDEVRVRAGGTEETFDHVVLAAGSWTRRVRVAGEPVIPVRPIRGQLLHLRPQSAAFIRSSVWGSKCYTVPWNDGSLLVGATVEDVGFDERSTAEGVHGLLSAVTELLPAAAGAAVDAIRVGLRPATADRLPLIGPLPHQPRVIAATGHYRNGILLAPLTAEVVAGLLLHGQRDAMLEWTRVDRVGLR